jgi:hypothetical protein
MKKKILYVGLDVHKKSIDVALASARPEIGKIAILRHEKLTISISATEH